MALPRKIPPLAALALGLALLLAPGTRAAERFFAAVEDLPVMPGLEEMTDATVVFDKPAGRIVAVAARGAVSRAQVLAYYARVLPQLGWRPAGPAAFRREDERLRLSFAREGAALVVRFALAPE